MAMYPEDNINKMNFLIHFKSCNARNSFTYVVHDHIKGTDPVGGDKEERVGIDPVEIADLSAGNEFEIRAVCDDNGRHDDAIFSVVW